MAKRVIEIVIGGKDEWIHGQESAIVFHKDVDLSFNMYDLEKYVRKNFGIVHKLLFDLVDGNDETGLDQWQIEGSFDDKGEITFIASIFEVDDNGDWNGCLFTDNDIPA